MKFENQVLCMDVREALSSIPDEVVQTVVTSPPYWGLRDYGLEPVIFGGDNGCQHEWRTEKGFDNSKKGNVGSTTASDPNHSQSSRFDSQHQFCSLCSAWRGSLGLEPTPELYVQHLVEIFREVRRVLKPDGTVWINLGDSFSVKSTHKGKRSGFQNSNERQEHRSDNRFGLCDGLKPKDLVGIPWRVAFALQADGWYLRSDIIWAKPNPMPESVTDRPTKSHEYLFLLSRSATYYYDQDAIREPALTPADSKDRCGFGSPVGKHDSPEKAHSNEVGKRWDKTDSRNRRSVWTIPTQPSSLPHFAQFPEKLVEPCVMAGSSEKGNCSKCGAPWVRQVEIKQEKLSGSTGSAHVPGAQNWAGITDRTRKIVKTLGWQPSCDCGADPEPAIVLDPFGGLGTVALVAKRHGRRWISIDLSQEYSDLATDRLRQEEMF